MKTIRYAFFVCAAFLVLSFLSSGFIPRAHAWAQLGCKWDHNGITYFNGASNVENSEISMAAEAWSDTPTLQYMTNVGTQQGANIAYSSVNDPNGGYTGVTTPAPCNNGLYNGQTIIQLNDPVLNGQPQDQIINSAAHETGHGLGLAHSQVNAALMWFSTDSYTSYGIIVPVIDDIRAAAQLYGWAADTGFSFSTTTGTGHFSGFNYPITLGVNSGCPGVCYAQGGKNTALPGSRIAVMSAYVRPLTLYRFHIGWEENSADPTDQSHRYATVEFDNDGGRLVYDKGGSLVSVPLKLPGGGSPPGINTNTSYFLEIVVEQNGGNANSVNAEVYAYQGNMQTANGGEGFQGSINLDKDVSCLFSTCSLDSWGSANLFDIGSWVDSSSNPASDYVVDHFWNFQGAVPKTPLAGTDFSLTSNGNSITLPVQQSGTFTLTATGLSVFAGTVTLTTAVSSQAVSASLNPTEIAVNQGAQGTSTLTVSGTASGTYTVTVTGTSVGISHSVSLTVIITDFTVSASPGSQTVAVGSTATTSVTVAAVNGFTGTVNLLLSSVPSGVSCTGLSASSYTPVTLSSTTTSASVNLSCTSNTAGTYQVSIYACYNCFAQNVLSHTTTATFIFAPPDFTISATSPAPVNVGSSTTSTITISPLYGFTGTVTLTDTVPSGLTCGAISPSTLTGSGTATVSCNATVANNYALTITGTSGSLTHSATATFSFVDFSISSSTSSMSLGLASSSGTDTITLGSLNGFVGTVSLSVSSSPSGPVVSVWPLSITLSGSASATLDLSAGAATPGTYAVTVTAVSGSLSHPVGITVTVTGDFSAVTAPGTLNIPVGSSGSSTITLMSQNGFSGTVGFATSAAVTISAVDIDDGNFRAFGLTIDQTLYTPDFWNKQPSSILGDASGSFSYSNTYSLSTGAHFLEFGVSAWVGHWHAKIWVNNVLMADVDTNVVSHVHVGFQIAGLSVSPSVTNGPTSSLSASSLNLSSGASVTTTLTVSTTSSTPLGTYTFTITATSAGLSHSVTLTVNVSDFSVSTNPTSVTVNAASAGTSTVTVSPINGFSNTVTLSVATNSTNLSCTLNPTSVSGGSGSSVLSCTGSVGANYLATVTGTSGGLSHSTTVVYHVQDFSVSTSPSSVSLTLAGSSSSSTVTLSSVNGFSGTVSLSASVSPSGPVVSLWPTSATLSSGGSATSTLDISAGGATPGTYTITVTGTSGSITRSATVTVTVSGDFSIASAPTSLSLTGKMSSSSTLTVASLNGFAGTVSFSGQTSVSISATSTDDRFQRSFGLLFDQTLNSDFWNSQPSSVIGVSYSPFSYSKTYTLTPGSHFLEFGVSAFVGHWHVSITVNGVVVASVDTDVNHHVHASFNEGGVSVTPSVSNGPSVSLSTSSVTLASGGSTTFTLTVSSTRQTALGTYSVVVTATSGGLSHSVTITVTVS